MDERILDAIRNVPEIAVLALFGSHAAGFPRADSDLDVAVLPAPDTSLPRRRLQQRIAVALADLAPEGRVDVVFVDEAPDLLRQRIMEKGRLILCNDPPLWRSWRVRTMREYGDREWVRRLYREAQRRKLLGGRGGRSGRALDSFECTRGYLAELRSFLRHSREEFIREPALHHLAERYLQLACECVLDTAHHVIADEGLRQATSYQDAMDVLRESGFLAEDLAERLKGWIGFRSVLVHFYLNVDHGRSHDAIREDLGDLEAFAVEMTRLLGPSGS